MNINQTKLIKSVLPYCESNPNGVCEFLIVKKCNKNSKKDKKEKKEKKSKWNYSDDSAEENPLDSDNDY